MKTFDEALSTLFVEDLDPDALAKHKQDNIRKFDEIGDDIMINEDVDKFIVLGAIAAAMEDLPVDTPDAVSVSYAIKLAFANGVRVGIEMEKSET
jgi:hypothetical protein